MAEALESKARGEDRPRTADGGEDAASARRQPFKRRLGRRLTIGETGGATVIAASQFLFGASNLYGVLDTVGNAGGLGVERMFKGDEVTAQQDCRKR